MLFELIRAFPAALLVGVVPGWFWAGCLCASADRAERLAYSVAFSVALVPTVALAQARLIGVSVTPAITVVSVLLVLGSDLILSLKLKPAKGSEPLAPLPAPLDLPALIPLIVASALVLGALFGVVPGEWATPAIGLSVLAAGPRSCSRLLEEAHRRNHTPPGHPGPSRRRVGSCFRRCCSWCSCGAIPVPCATTGRSRAAWTSTSTR